MLLNRSRAIDYMRRCELDAIVATSPVNVRYLSDFYCWLAPLFREYMVSPGGSSRLVQQNFALLPLDGEPAVVVEPYFAIDAVRTWVEDIRIAGGADFELPDDDHTGNGTARLDQELSRAREIIRGGSAETPAEALAAAVKDRGLAESPLGVDLDGLSDEVAAELRDRLPRARLLDCTNLLRLIRAVKSDDEVARLERAASAAEDAATAAFASAGPGWTLSELEAVYRARLGELGVEFDHFAFGPRGLGIASFSDYALSPGDAVYADWGCLYAGYCSDTGTTLAVGELAPDLQHRFDATVASVQAGAGAARPGVLASEVQAVMQASMRDAGISATYPHGHGFGLEVRDYPIVTRPTGRPIHDDVIDTSSDLPLEEGMVFNLEAPVFILGRGSVHTERSFLVTAGGCRPLIDQDRRAPAMVSGAPSPAARRATR
jgi:Xaa-Pro aminopeptidase